ncbi:hypothetical protein ACFVWG_33860 [Kribbella sp. NPDC058245]
MSKPTWVVGGTAAVAVLGLAGVAAGWAVKQLSQYGAVQRITADDREERP